MDIQDIFMLMSLRQKILFIRLGVLRIKKYHFLGLCSLRLFGIMFCSKLHFYIHIQMET